MIRQYTATGATVDEAIANACKELGVSPDEVRPEILRFPKKGFLGIGKVTAEVRVSIETEDEPKKPVKKQAPAAPKGKPAEGSAPSPKRSETPALKTEKPAPQPQKEEKTAQEKKPQPEKTVPAEPAQTAPASTENLQPKMDAAEAYLREIFEKMGITDLSVRMEPMENRTVMIHLDGESIGTVIGKRGETLDAIQYLVSLAANRSEGEYVRFTINAGNYREKREETLKALAQRMAKKALKTGRPVALEPMNPYERRIIHAVVTDMEGVFSKSTGEEPNRRVVIKPTSKPSTRRSGGKGRSGRPNRPAPNSAENSTPEAVSTEPVEIETPVKEEKVILDDVKLYSKIEL